MNTTILNVPVRVATNAIHITNDDALWQLIHANPVENTYRLIDEINSAFLEKNKRDIEISRDSLAVEIWGHVYADHFADVIDNLTNLKLIEKMVHPIQKYCAIIDCGEKGYDQNRWFWDLLAPFTGIIGKLLPKEKKNNY